MSRHSPNGVGRSSLAGSLPVVPQSSPGAPPQLSQHFPPLAGSVASCSSNSARFFDPALPASAPTLFGELSNEQQRLLALVLLLSKDSDAPCRCE